MGHIDNRPPMLNREIVSQVNRRSAPAQWGYIDEITSRFRCNVQTLTGDYFENVLLPAGSLIGGKPKGRFMEWRAGQRVLVSFVGGSPANPVVVSWYPTPAQEKYARDLDTFLDGPDSADLPANETDFVDYHPSGYAVLYKDGVIQVKDGTDEIFKLDMSGDEARLKIGKLTIDGDLDVTGEVTWKKGTADEIAASGHGHLKAIPGDPTKPIQVVPPAP